MKPGPEIIELDEQELRAKLDRIEAALGAETASPFRRLLQGYITLLALLRDTKITIARLRKLAFGPWTERSSEIIPDDQDAEKEDASESSAESSIDPPDAEAGNEQAEQEDVSTPPADASSPTTDNPSSADASSPDADASSPTDGSSSNHPSPGDGSANGSDKGNGKAKRGKGHGRNPASAYTGCNQVVLTHDALSPGDDCPDCQRGTVYRQSEWSLIVRLKGQPPVGGTVYQLERLRCHLRGNIYKAELPEDAGPAKHDPTVPAIIATLRYGEGFPWNRIQRIQAAAGIPLPASTQWQLVRDAIPGGIQAARRHLVELAARGDLLHNDDTHMQVLALTRKKKLGVPLLEEDPERSGVFTTGILSLAAGRPTIALFFTGPYHAGENLSTVLGLRQEELPLPIQMCDGLSRNIPKDLRVILANCLTHGRRKFVDVLGAFPAEVKYVIKCFKQVYKTDAEAREQQLSPAERLQLHQARSQRVMDELHQWLRQQLDEKKVEPNSSLGGAISYMLKRWDELTLFLRVPGAPLDNNLCERALKMAIRHRRNSLFYLLNGKPHYPANNIGPGPPEFRYAHFANSGLVDADGFTRVYHLSQVGEDGYVPHIEPLGNGILFRADPELETYFGEERPYYHRTGTIESPSISTTATAVPEPSQWAMMVLTLIGCLGRLALRWKRPACIRASAAK